MHAQQQQQEQRQEQHQQQHGYAERQMGGLQAGLVNRKGGHRAGEFGHEHRDVGSHKFS